MFGLTQRKGSFGLRCDEAGLFLAGVPLLWSCGNRFEPRPKAELDKIFSGAYRSGDDWSRQSSGIGTVARALNEGDVSLAMIAAVLLKLKELDWDAAVRIADLEDRLVKGGFNPNEPRNQHGEWTSGPDEGDEHPSPAAIASHSEPQSAHSDLFEDVAYQGTFHDQLVRDWAENLRSLGATVATEVLLVGVNGVSARTDIMLKVPGQKHIFVIEVKTGLNPRYTDPQRSVYPLAMVGGHVTSMDRRVTQLGLVPGEPFPPLIIYQLYQFGPNSSFDFRRIPPEYLP